MLIPDHPDDEVLSAYAAGDAEGARDASIAPHLSSCQRCADLVDELSGLRASLADLPDLRPPRPLRLLPPVEEPATQADGLATWVRRLFAPALAAGATLALVGAVGTASPATFQDVAADLGSGERTTQMEAEPSAAPAEGAAAAPAASDEAEDGEIMTLASPATDAGGADDPGAAGADEYATLPAERSPWPMVLFSGVALVLGAVLLRWIVVPRAG